MEKNFSGHQKNRKSFSEFITEKVWKPNMGDLAEPILACGVATKFANPDSIVSIDAIK